MEKETQLYEGLADRHEAAYGSFLRQYTLEHPQPSEPKWFQGLPLLMIPFGLIAVAAISLSALRTAPVFQQVAMPVVGLELSYVEAVLAIIVIEVFVVTGRYVLLLFQAKTKSLNADEVKGWIRAGFWTAFSVAVLANLYASSGHLPMLQPIKPVVDLIIGVLVGISAPFLAFIIADILAVLWITSERHRKELREQFQTAMSDYLEARQRVWNTVKTRQYGIKVEVEREPVQKVSNGNSIGNPVENVRAILPSVSTLGHTKQPDASKKVRDYLAEHEEALEMNPLEIAAMLGVGKSTVYNVLKDFKK